MAEITIYEKPTCTTCTNLYTLLTERGIDPERVDYHVEGLPEPKLRELLRKAGNPSPREWLRVREAEVTELGLLDPDRSDDELIALMAAHPKTIQRPIVEVGERAVLARPVERVLDLLDVEGAG